MEKTIALVGTLDTKSKEYVYVKEIIERNHYNVITIDIGTGFRGKPAVPRIIQKKRWLRWPAVP